MNEAQPCLEFEHETASSTESTNAGASSAASGSGSTTSASPGSAPAEEAANAKTAGTAAAISIDGWRCEDFSGQTGHGIGRSAQLGDLQLCLTVGETDGSGLPGVPERVIRWLMMGASE